MLLNILVTWYSKVSMSIIITIVLILSNDNSTENKICRYIFISKSSFEKKKSFTLVNREKSFYENRLSKRVMSLNILMHWCLKYTFKNISRRINSIYSLSQTQFCFGNNNQSVCENIWSKCFMPLNILNFWCFKDTFKIIFILALNLNNRNST